MALGPDAPAKTDAAPPDDRYWVDLLRPVFAGRRVILTGEPVAGLLPKARLVHTLGAQRPFILGTQGVGTGPLPRPDEAEWLALDPTPTTSFMEAIRSGQALLADLPTHARAALDDYDPDRSAIVLGSLLNDLSEVAGRPCLGHREPRWVALEDKTVIDGFWDRAGIARMPSEVVPARRDALVAAAERLEAGSGTVWVADTRDGIHGGADGARWIRTRRDVDEALAFVEADADRVRVMPFHEGIPCSIHGVVFPDYVAALRPVEMVTLRSQVHPSRLFYAGAASYWDPLPQDREHMRALARRAGGHLREVADFRGAFTVDGVMTEHGFRPTELNPRQGAGMSVLARGLPGLPLPLLCDAVSAGVDLDYRPRELERHVVRRADRQRGGGTWRAVPAPLAPIENQAVARGPGGYRWASDGEPPDGWVGAGPSAIGGFVRLTLNAARTEIGASVAPVACDFFRFADQHLHTGVGPLEPAKPTRTTRAQ